MANTNRNTTSQKSTAPQGAKAAASSDDADLPDFSTWSALQIGFAPYWHPEPGKKFYGEIIARDDRDPEFVRYLVKTLKDEPCRRGPNNDDTSKGAIGEMVTVPKGETFSLSVYYSLANEFDYHLYFAQKTGRHIPVLVEATKTVKTKAGNDCWQWRALVNPDDKKELESHRDGYRRLQNGEDGTERAALES